MKFLMCRPDYFNIDYEINPWMDINKATNRETVSRQWENLYQTLRTCGAQIALIDPIAGLPDMVFTANAGLLYQKKIYLSHFKFKERQGEEDYFQHWFKEAGFDVITTPFAFEGSGDALPVAQKLFVAYGFRSDKAYYETNPDFNQANLIYCELTNPYFYHLDTCFCPLDESSAIWFPDGFTEKSRERMQAAIELIAVPQAEAERFACNAVILDKQIILPTGCPTLTATLKNRGFNVFSCEMDEFLKAGGACKCLTMRID